MTNAPKIVMEHVDDILHGLRISNFFKDFTITEDFAKKHFTELLVELYIEDPTMGEEFFWSEEEFEVILQKIITGSIMYELVDDGILGSYEDENTEETFFLTEVGKELKDKLEKER